MVSKDILRLHTTDSVEGLWKTLFKVVNHAMPIQGFCGLVEPFQLLPDHSGYFHYSVGSRSEQKQRTIDSLREGCLFLKWFDERPGSLTVWLSDLRQMKGMDLRAFEEDHLKPNGWRHGVALAVRQRKEVTGFLAVFRTEENHDFSQWERYFLEHVIQPHFKTALSRIISLHDRLMKRQALERGLAEWDTPVMILDWKLGVLHENAAAKRCCARWLASDHHQESNLFPGLPEALANSCLHLKHDYETSVRDGQPVTRSAELEVVCDVSLSAKVRWIWPRRNYRGKPLFEIIFLACGEKVGGGDICWESSPLQEYRLSAAERHVAELVCQGMTNQEIAQKLDKQTDTVKKQLQSIFRKMDICSRGKLISLLTRPGS